jgi:CHAT domain-containing protein
VPVHAAGIYHSTKAECVADYVVSSYTPTLAALARAQERAASGFSVKQSKIVLIAAERAYDATLHNLPCVSAEIGAVETVATREGVNVDTLRTSVSATAANVTASLPSAHLVHIACHGIQHPKMPLESGFCLTDDRLTIARLMELSLEHAFLAFLSACETAKGDEKQPDQTIHLAAAMLFVGFKSVVATMW